MLFRMQTNKNHIFDNMWKDFQKGLRIKNPIAFRKKKDRLDFLIIEENETVGFVLMGVYPNSLTPFDGFIQAFYIKPEFRDKGYARNALKEIMSNYMGLSMYILKSDKKGRSFWNHVFRRFGYEDRTTCFTSLDIGRDATFHLWYPEGLTITREVK